jgi:hypothetical protein
MTSGVQVRLALAGGLVSAWYRAAPSASEEDREWVQIASAVVATDGGAGVASSRVEWGHRSGAVAYSAWYSVQAVSDKLAGGTLAEGQSNPADLQGRLYATEPEYISEGVSAWSESGFGLPGDLSYISTAYGYPIEAIFPEIQPSPRIPWRSTSDAAQVTVALRLDPSFIADCGLFNDIIGLALYGINFREFRLQGYSGAWTTIATYYADYLLSGLRYTRTGNTVQSSGVDGTNSPYLQFDEFAGCSFVFDDGTIRKIAHNSEGQFGSGHKRPTLILEDCDGTEDIAGTAGSIRSTSVVGLVKLGGANYSAYRLLIPVQDTADGYFEVGTMILGPVAVFGAESSWGRSVATEPNREDTEAADWTRRTRSRAPARRTIEIGWTDGVDQTGSYSGDPDYLLAVAGGVAVASTRDVPSQVEGLVRSLAGPGREVVYLPAIPYVGSTVTLNRRWQHVLGEVISPVSVETMLGEEGSTEVARVPNLTILEVV